MRTIERSGQFRRDYKRELKGLRGRKLPRDLAGLLIYAKPDTRTLQLVRLGSHCELFD